MIMPAPATNIGQILAWSGAIDPAVADQLASAGVPAYIPRSREDVPDVYALPLFIKGGSDGHLARMPENIGGYEFDLFPGSIVGVEIFAPRISDETTPEGATVIAGVYDILEELAVRSRYAFRFNAGRQLNDRLPFHKLTHLKPLADVIGFDEDRKVDRFELRWQCTAGILPSAWPTDPAGYILPDPAPLPVAAS